MKRLVSIILVMVLSFTLVTVFAEEISVSSIKIGLSSNAMKVGETQKIIISVTPTNAEANLEYESDNPEVVTAAIGTLIANSEGIANITVKVSGTDIKDTVTVTVSNRESSNNDNNEDVENDVVENEEVKVSKISVENKTLYLERYETERIVYSVYPDNATNEDVLFESSNTSVATVDDRGYVYAKREGNATITVESEDGNASATVRVYVSDEDDEDYDSSLRSIYITYDDEIINDDFEVMESTTEQLSIKAYPSSASKKVTWRSSNSRIAKVDSNGKVTGVRKGSCTIYATSTVNSSKKDSIKIVVTDYVKYPERITVTPQENAVFETGNMVQFMTELYPNDITEYDIIWKATGGANITQGGLLQITDGGEITVKAYSSDNKTFGEYKFNAMYSKNHFSLVGSAYNLTNNRVIEMYFDTNVSAWSAMTNIFATADESGNGEKMKLSVKTTGKKITVSPIETWPEGDVYIFIRNSLCDVNGNWLGKNLKYKLNIRGNVYDK